MGSSYNTYVHFDFSHSIDTQSYLKTANGDFNVNPVHRYRVIVPFLAKVVSIPFESVYTKIWDKRKANTWPLQLGYYIINSLLCALAGLVLFELARSYGISSIWALVAITAILTSRWLNYMAGLPLTDSLYILVIVSAFLALRNGNSLLLISVIILGPFAKESFLFIAPIIFFYAKMSWIKKTSFFIASGLIVFGVRFMIDNSIGESSNLGFDKALDTFTTLSYSLNRMFSIKGIGEIFSVIGVFWFVIVLGFWKSKKDIMTWAQYLDAPIVWLVLSILIHMLLSGDIGRMMLFAAPTFVVVIGLILEHHPKFKKLRHSLNLRKN